MCRRGRQYGQKPECHKHGDEKRDEFFHSETVLRIFLSARQSIGHMSILALRILNVNRYINHLYCISAKNDSERETEQKKMARNDEKRQNKSKNVYCCGTVDNGAEKCFNMP